MKIHWTRVDNEQSAEEPKSIRGTSITDSFIHVFLKEFPSLYEAALHDGDKMRELKFKISMINALIIKGKNYFKEAIKEKWIETNPNTDLETVYFLSDLDEWFETNKPPTILNMRNEIKESVYKCLQSYFNKQDHHSLKNLLEGGKREGEKILFKGKGIIFINSFKYLLHNEQLLGMIQESLAYWICENFQFEKKGKPAAFNFGTVKKNLPPSVYSGFSQFSKEDIYNLFRKLDFNNS